MANHYLWRNGACHHFWRVGASYHRGRDGAKQRLRGCGEETDEEKGRGGNGKGRHLSTRFKGKRWRPEVFLLEGEESMRIELTRMHRQHSDEKQHLLGYN